MVCGGFLNFFHYFFAMVRIVVEVDEKRLKACSLGCPSPVECSVVGYLCSVDREGVFGDITFSDGSVFKDLLKKMGIHD